MPKRSTQIVKRYIIYIYNEWLAVNHVEVMALLSRDTPFFLLDVHFYICDGLFSPSSKCYAYIATLLL